MSQILKIILFNNTSVGPDDCSGKKPGVYTATHAYVNWIEEKMKGIGLYISAFN